MLTLRDVLKQKQLADDAFNARIDAREAESKRIAQVLANHPEIGVLNGGKYYTIKNGQYKQANNPENLV